MGTGAGACGREAGSADGRSEAPRSEEDQEARPQEARYQAATHRHHRSRRGWHSRRAIARSQKKDRRPMIRSAWALCLVVVMTVNAAAQSAQVQAEALFRQGKELMAAKK